MQRCACVVGGLLRTRAAPLARRAIHAPARASWGGLAPAAGVEGQLFARTTARPAHQAWARVGASRAWLSGEAAAEGASSADEAAAADAAAAGATAGDSAQQGGSEEPRADGAESGVSDAEQSGEEGTDPSARIAELEAEVKELQQSRLRLLAEMENVRNIARRDVDTARSYAIQSFAKALLSVTDNLERAVSSVPAEARDGSNAALESLYEGVVMTEAELLKVFAANGIEKFGAPGDEFDPHRHNALFEAPAPDIEPGRISTVLKAGYSFRDRILRPADVGTTPP